MLSHTIMQNAGGSEIKTAHDGRWPFPFLALTPDFEDLETCHGLEVSRKEEIGSDIYSRQWEEGGTHKEEWAWLVEQFKPGCERKSKAARFHRTDRPRISSFKPSKSISDCYGHLLLLRDFLFQFFHDSEIASSAVLFILFLSRRRIPALDFVAGTVKIPYRTLQS